MTKKLTKKDLFNQILTSYDLTEEHVAFIEHELELLEKKGSNKSGKMTATQVANEKLKGDIVEFMEDGATHSIADIMAGVETLNGLTNQKVSALMKQLTDAGAVIRTTEKRKAYFTKA